MGEGRTGEERKEWEQRKMYNLIKAILKMNERNVKKSRGKMLMKKYGFFKKEKLWKMESKNWLDWKKQIYSLLAFRFVFPHSCLNDIMNS